MLSQYFWYFSRVLKAWVEWEEQKTNEIISPAFSLSFKLKIKLSLS